MHEHLHADHDESHAHQPFRGDRRCHRTMLPDWAIVATIGPIMVPDHGPKMAVSWQPQPRLPGVELNFAAEND